MFTVANVHSFIFVILNLKCGKDAFGSAVASKAPREEGQPVRGEPTQTSNKGSPFGLTTPMSNAQRARLEVIANSATSRRRNLQPYQL